MKIIVFLMILTLSIASFVNAGLDSDNMLDHVIAVYHFESIQRSETGGRYTPDSSSRGFHASLWDGATLTDGGKYGQGLQLREQSELGGGTWNSATVDDEFSIVAWIKLQKQQPDVRFSIVLADRIRAGDRQLMTTAISIAVQPNGEISGGYIDLLTGGAAVLVESQGENVVNNKWRHIALTRYAKDYKLFVDGRLIAKRQSKWNPYFFGNFTTIEISITNDKNITGSILVDDAGFFETGFSSYEIKGLYNSNLQKFLEEMSVTPQGRLTTTWGDVKSLY